MMDEEVENGVIWLNVSKENQFFLVTHVNLTPACQKCHILVIALKFSVFLEKSNESSFQLKTKIFAQVWYPSSL